MAVAKTPELDEILSKVQQLPPEKRLWLIARIAESLYPAKTAARPGLIYGCFRGKRMSTLEDFRLAEWKPPEERTHATDMDT